MKEKLKELKEENEKLKEENERLRFMLKVKQKRIDDLEGWKAKQFQERL